MSTLLFVLRRLSHSVFVLVGLSILIFVLARVMPGDPARLTLGPLATSEQVEKLSQEMNLDKPIYLQYYIWLKSALRGDFGKSLITRRPIAQDIATFLPATLELAFAAFIISVVIGQLLGIGAGQARNSWFDNLARMVSYAGVVTPPFVFAIFFLLIFSYALGFVPPVGRLSMALAAPPTVTGFLVLDGMIAGDARVVLDAIMHLILPAASLAMMALAGEARITRSSIADNLGKDYVAAHRVYGIPRRQVMFKYLLKPSIIPTVAIIGLDFAAMLSNAFLVEKVFMWPGFSRYGIDAMLNKDLNAIIVVILVLGVAFLTVNVVVDILIGLLDPRIRFRSGGG
jgi:peptide/nickel transport system permease protein